MKTKLHLLYFLLYLFFCSTLYAQQNPQPHFRNYSTEHGLPSPEVYCVFEDSRGYMWFGTDNGAARFDGYEFKTYGAKEGLMSNVVFDIHEDGKGRIWFGTMTGETFILENKNIIQYKYQNLIKKYEGRFKKSTIFHLEKNQTAYFELRELGFLKIDSLGNSKLFKGNFPNVEIGFEIETDSKIFNTNSKNSELGDPLGWNEKMRNEKIGYIELVGNNSKRFSKKLPRSVGNETYMRMHRLPTNELLVFGLGFLNCVIDTQLIWSIPSSDNIFEISTEEEGTIWLSMARGEGLRKYKNLENLKRSQYKQYFNGLDVSNFFKDSKGGYWVTTTKKGIFYCSEKNILTYNSNFGFSDNFVQTVTFKKDNELFVGLKNRDIVHFNILENQIKNVIQSPKIAFNFDLFYDNNSNILYSRFLKWIDGKWILPKSWNPSLKKYSIASSNLKKLKSISKNELGGVNQNGFLILDKKKHISKLQFLDSKRERTLDFHLASDKRLWIGNLRGIFQFKDSTLVHPNISHPAFHNRVEDIDELPDSTLVFGTKGFGVIAWKGDSILQITDDDGLTSNMLEEVHVDENGILWAGTLNGLNKITFGKNGKPIVRTFTTYNGLPSNEIYQIKSYNGQVWLCTAGGLVKFHEVSENTESPSPILQWTKVNDSETNIINTASFAHDQNNFEFRYLAINYRMNGKINYRYRIHKNEDWRYTQTLNVNYPSLPPDGYTFEVQGQNEDGYWSKSTSYDFTVLPPWWATWWFRLASVLSLGFIGYRLYRYRTNQLKKENAIQQQMTNLEKSALQAQMNPHFIFNTLNSIQNFILKNNTKKAVEYLSRFAQLVRHNLNASVQGEVSLEEEISILDNYLALEQERFEHQFEYEINVDELLEKDFIEFPPMLIQPYVENAVIHGLAEKEGKGKVDIHFSRNNGSLLVTIKDNGVGYRKDKKGETSKRHKSVGMTVTKKRLELLGANSDDAVQIQSFENGNGEKEGTLVKIKIALKEANQK